MYYVINRVSCYDMQEKSKAAKVDRKNEVLEIELRNSKSKVIIMICIVHCTCLSSTTTATATIHVYTCTVLHVKLDH